MMRHRALWLALAIIVVLVATMFLQSGALHAPTAPETNGQPNALSAVVADVEAGRVTTPLVGDQPRRGMPTVTFLAKRAGQDAPRIVSDATGWGERADGSFNFNVGKMTRIEQSEWYALEVKVEPYARIEYLIVYGGSEYRVDPHNPRQVQRANGNASEFVMPGYVPPQEFVDAPTTPAGGIFDTAVDSRALKGSRHVIVYTPPGYDKGTTYPLAVFHDGALVVNNGQAPRVLDWLITHQAIPPIVAVFVDPQSRAEDLRRGSPMRTFVTDELLPWMSERYNVTSNPADRAIIGISAGARGAIDAVSTSNQFGRVGLLIPALDMADIESIPPASRRKLRVSILAGVYDALNLSAARSAQLEFAEKGHTVQFKDVPEGHSTITWRNHLRDVLIELFK